MNDLNTAINDFLNYYVHDGDRKQAEQELQKLVVKAYEYGQNLPMAKRLH